MTVETEILQSALATVNATGKQVNDALTKLLEHNTDIEAHDDIRAILKKLVNSDNIYTNDQIVALIQKAMDAHSKENFRDAHTGWNDVASDIDRRFQNIAAEISNLDARIKDLENGGDEDGGTPTSLKSLINQINAKYEPRIATLTDLIAQATANKDDELVASYQESLQTTLNNRNKEIAQATADWVASQSGAPKE